MNQVPGQATYAGPQGEVQAFEEYKAAGKVAFSIIADVSTAHRRFKHVPDEHGL